MVSLSHSPVLQLELAVICQTVGCAWNWPTGVVVALHGEISFVRFTIMVSRCIANGSMWEESSGASCLALSPAFLFSMHKLVWSALYSFHSWGGFVNGCLDE